MEQGRILSGRLRVSTYAKTPYLDRLLRRFGVLSEGVVPCYLQVKLSHGLEVMFRREFAGGT